MKLNLDEYFYPVPGSEQEGEIVIFARRHWVSFLGQVLLSFVLLILPIVIGIALNYLGTEIYLGSARNLIVIGLSIYYLVVITFTFAAWISYYYDIYIVTKDTIIDITQMGFFGRKVSQLSLLRVQDVSSHIKGIWPTMFAYGDVLIETAGEQAQNFLLKAVPNPQQVSAKILELHTQLIQREGRGKEMLEAEGVIPPGKVNPPKETPPKEEEQEIPSQSKTPYQKQLQKELEEKSQGEISKDDLNKGGEVKF